MSLAFCHEGMFELAHALRVWGGYCALARCAQKSTGSAQCMKTRFAWIYKRYFLRVKSEKNRIF